MSVVNVGSAEGQRQTGRRATAGATGMVIDGRPERTAAEDPAGPVRPVKLVVWDLDDTLWEGTLSEGRVTLPPSRAQLVRTLNRRGIVNSVCSKNDPSRARAELERRRPLGRAGLRPDRLDAEGRRGWPRSSSRCPAPGGGRPVPR